MKEVRAVELVIKGDPKEIAALVWELQERRDYYLSNAISSKVLTGEAVHLSGEKVGSSFLTAK